MVPMETQLQSIFEEVVVSATVRKPEPWLREVQAACGSRLRAWASSFPAPMLT